jgi:hypothetical protein
MTASAQAICGDEVTATRRLGAGARPARTPRDTKREYRGLRPSDHYAIRVPNYIHLSQVKLRVTRRERRAGTCRGAGPQVPLECTEQADLNYGRDGAKMAMSCKTVWNVHALSMLGRAYSSGGAGNSMTHLR